MKRFLQLSGGDRGKNPFLEEQLAVEPGVGVFGRHQRGEQVVKGRRSHDFANEMKLKSRDYDVRDGKYRRGHPRGGG